MARVEIFERDDGTFSFIEEISEIDIHYFTGEQTRYWAPRVGGGRFASAEIALREAIGRVSWLNDMLGT
ncbi:MAG: hypothetical protein KGO53_14530 [Alphaproteobacteria bacterium]|nr:hypothetical protein [Alphaproteobacteria bacterium]